MTDKKKESVEMFVYKVSTEGLAYAIQNYPPSKDAPKDLIKVVKNAQDVLGKVESIMEKYMDKFDLEYS